MHHTLKMRAIAVIVSTCLLNCAFALPTPTAERIFLPNREIKSDGSADWSRVVGGSTASKYQFPYIASLRRSDTHFCAGVIISEYYVLSAAHCTTGSSASSVTVVVGTTTLDEYDGIPYSLARIANHEDYDYYTMVNDISLLRTATFITESNTIFFIPIWTDWLGSGFTVTLAGWGSTEPSGNGGLAYDLQYVTLQTINNQDCERRLSPEPVFDSSLCTLTEVGEGACYGDSGGPLVYNGFLVGLVSWGQPCAVGYPDVFTRISSYAKWIGVKAI